MRAVLSEAYRRVDHAFFVTHPSELRTGCCCLTVLVGDSSCYVANVGDCRCVLVSLDGKERPVTKALSANHDRIFAGTGKNLNDDAHSYTECSRVQRRTEDPLPIAPRSTATPRVAGVLTVTRALGNAFLKMPRFPRFRYTPYITASPEVHHWGLPPNGFLVMMTDGVYNWATDGELGRIVTAAVRNESPSNPAQAVLDWIVDHKVLVAANMSRAELEARPARRTLLDDMTLVIISL